MGPLIDALHQNGMNEQDKVKVVLKATNSIYPLIQFLLLSFQIGKEKLMYQENQKTSFQFEFCWKILGATTKMVGS
jgi:hypothetical protein